MKLVGCSRVEGVPHFALQFERPDCPRPRDEVPTIVAAFGSKLRKDSICRCAHIRKQSVEPGRGQGRYNDTLFRLIAEKEDSRSNRLAADIGRPPAHDHAAPQLL